MGASQGSGHCQAGASRILTTLLGDYPGTRSLKDGSVVSDTVAFDFEAAPVPNRFFKQVVRERHFDVAELAIATFLQARSVGRPLVLLPATVLGRHQHARLVHDAARGPMTPASLEGRRVGVRSWSVTTVMWVRGVLASDFGVDLDAVRWVTFEDPHVPGIEAPPGVEAAPPGSDPLEMLQAGELDAAVIGGPPPEGSSIRALIADPDDAARDWCRRNGAVMVNHLVTVDADLSRNEPDTVAEVYRMLVEGRARAPATDDHGFDLLPFGVEALRPSLEVAIDYAAHQGLLARALTVDELFDSTTLALSALQD